MLRVFAALLVFPGLTMAQSYPVKPIRLVIPYPPGGVDITIRLILPVGDQEMGQPVVIDYRPGAGIRVAPHFYTTDAEVERLVHEVDDILATGAWRAHEGARRVVT